MKHNLSALPEEQQAAIERHKAECLQRFNTCLQAWERYRNNQYQLQQWLEQQPAEQQPAMKKVISGFRRRAPRQGRR